jgi:hypothetical protein
MSRQALTGAGIFTLSTGRATTGAGSWIDLKGAYSHFGLQCIRLTTGTTAFTVQLQGTLTTATTNPRVLISYTRAADNSSLKASTAASLPPVNKIRFNVTVLGGTSGAGGFGVKIYASAKA